MLILQLVAFCKRHPGRRLLISTCLRLILTTTHCDLTSITAMVGVDISCRWKKAKYEYEENDPLSGRERFSTRR